MPILQRSLELRSHASVLRRDHHNPAPQLAEVAALLAFGLSADEIAETRGTSPSTARSQMRTLFREALATGVAKSSANLAAWVWLHSGCCMASPMLAARRAYPAVEERLSATQEHHVGLLSSREKQILIFEAFGLSEDEVGRSLFLSPSAIRFAAGAAWDKVTPEGARRSRGTATAWTHLHFCIERSPARRPPRFGEQWQKRLHG